jgi:hypothetical protein
VQVAQADGSASMAKIIGQATSGTEPQLVMMAPVDAIKKLIKKTGWSLDEVDLIELNEAFSVQAVAITRELNLDPEKINVNGGAVGAQAPATDWPQDSDAWWQPRNSSGADNPPMSATPSSTSMKARARPVSMNRDSQAPTPRADRYRPITSENCVTESPST